MKSRNKGDVTIGIRDDVVDETVREFISLEDYDPSETDIRLVSNEIGDIMVENECHTQKQWDRLSQKRTVELVKKDLSFFRKHHSY
ncbi:hypothetical protein KAU33_15620 [Candidatus Dependentiae bacterium]|nr:hypothetical protein [Candidatus Dependentiae bacterium]